MLELHRQAHLRSPRSPTPSTSAVRSASPPPQILLVASTFSQQLRRAGLDAIKRTLKAKRFSNSRLRPLSEQQETLERYPSRIGERTAKVEVHLLVLQQAVSEQDKSTRSFTLQAFRSQGAKVVHHQLPVGAIISRRSSFQPDKASQLQAAFEKGSLHKIRGELLKTAGVVFDDADGDQVREKITTAFIKGLNRQSTTGATLPTITIYLPPHPHLGEFDLDLPPEQVYAVQVANSAARTLLSTCPKSNPNATTSAVPSSTPDDQHLRPLLLRPAPGPGAQSISMRLSLGARTDDKDKDVILRVAECQTPPASPVTTKRMSRTWDRRQQAGQDVPSIPILGHRRSVSHQPISNSDSLLLSPPRSSARRSPSPADSSSSIPSSKSRSSSATHHTRPRPNLKLSIPFSLANSTSDNSSVFSGLSSAFSPDTPASSSVAPVVRHSPIERVTLKGHDSVAETTVSSAVDDAGRDGEASKENNEFVVGLLKQRAGKLRPLRKDTLDSAI